MGLGGCSLGAVINLSEHLTRSTGHQSCVTFTFLPFASLRLAAVLAPDRWEAVGGCEAFSPVRCLGVNLQVGRQVDRKLPRMLPR